MSLTRRQLIELARAVEARRAALAEELEDDLARLYHHVPGAEVADATRDDAELRALEAARRRIAEGSYGICTDCGADVGVERLRAEPSAARCIACQRRHEKTYRD